MIQSSCTPEADRLRAMAGRAKVRAVLSTATSRTGNISRANATQSRQGAWGRVASGVLVAAVIDGVLMSVNYTVWTVQLRNAGPCRHDGRHAQETRRPRGRPRCL